MDARFTLAGAGAGRVRAIGKAGARRRLDVNLLCRGCTVIRLLSRVRRLAICAIPSAGAAASIHSGQYRVAAPAEGRSEEHTSELQSLRHLVCRLLLEKKKQ